MTVIELPETKEASSAPCVRSHIRTVASVPPEMARHPSALTATARTGPVWPVRVCSRAPVSRSHARASPSPPPTNHDPPVHTVRRVGDDRGST